VGKPSKNLGVTAATINIDGMAGMVVVDQYGVLGATVHCFLGSQRHLIERSGRKPARANESSEFMHLRVIHHDDLMFLTTNNTRM
jgi:hypothetical protein